MKGSGRRSLPKVGEVYYYNHAGTSSTRHIIIDTIDDYKIWYRIVEHPEFTDWFHSGSLVITDGSLVLDKESKILNILKYVDNL